MRMAIHAGLRWRDGRFCRDFYRVVTISTVNAEFARMHCVTEWNWLRRLIPDVGRVGAEAESHHEDDIQRRKHPDDNRGWQKEVGPPRKYKVIATHRPLVPAYL